MVVLALVPSFEMLASIAKAALFADAVKLTPEMVAPLTVTVWLAGLKVKPDFVGVTVYVPFATLLNV